MNDIEQGFEFFQNEDSIPQDAESKESEGDNFYFDHSLLEQVYTQSQSPDDEEWSYTFEDEESETESMDVDDDSKRIHNISLFWKSVYPIT